MGGHIKNLPCPKRLIIAILTSVNLEDVHKSKWFIDIMHITWNQHA